MPGSAGSAGNGCSCAPVMQASTLAGGTRRGSGVGCGSGTWWWRWTQSEARPQGVGRTPGADPGSSRPAGPQAGPRTCPSPGRTKCPVRRRERAGRRLAVEGRRVGGVGTAEAHALRAPRTLRHRKHEIPQPQRVDDGQCGARVRPCGVRYVAHRQRQRVARPRERGEPCSMPMNSEPSRCRLTLCASASFTSGSSIARSSASSNRKPRRVANRMALCAMGATAREGGAALHMAGPRTPLKRAGAHRSTRSGSSSSVVCGSMGVRARPERRSSRP